MEANLAGLELSLVLVLVVVVVVVVRVCVVQAGRGAAVAAARERLTALELHSTLARSGGSTHGASPPAGAHPGSARRSKRRL